MKTNLIFINHKYVLLRMEHGMFKKILGEPLSMKIMEDALCPCGWMAHNPKPQEEKLEGYLSKMVQR